MEQQQLITVKTTVNIPIQKAWEYFTLSEHVKEWNRASDDWHTPKAENDLRVGGKFIYRMEAKDGSFGFDFGGVYDEVENEKKIAYTLGDGRMVSVNFVSDGKERTNIVETFEPEHENSPEMQQQGWQAILDHFKNYVEGL